MTEKSQENVRLLAHVAECEQELPKLQCLKELSNWEITSTQTSERRWMSLNASKSTPLSKKTSTLRRLSSTRGGRQHSRNSNQPQKHNTTPNTHTHRHK